MIDKYLKSLNDDYIEYVGIAYDEPKRYERLKDNPKKKCLLYEGRGRKAECPLWLSAMYRLLSESP